MNVIDIDLSKVDTTCRLTPEQLAQAEAFDKWCDTDEGRAAHEMIEAQYRTYERLDKSAKT
jgi:hypothetical protein